MQMLGERQIAAPRQVVWDTLNDARVLKSCLRGCDRLERVSEAKFEATIAARVGPIKTTFVGWVALSDIDPPTAYTISFEGKGGAAGFAKGRARVRLSEGGGGTLLQYAVDASLGGKMGQMGSRVVDGVARQLADDFFGQFAEIIGHSADADNAVAPTAIELQGKRPSPLQWWLVGLALTALALAGFFLLR
jgi:uncharacterized protein